MTSNSDAQLVEKNLARLASHEDATPVEPRQCRVTLAKLRALHSLAILAATGTPSRVRKAALRELTAGLASIALVDGRVRRRERPTAWRVIQPDGSEWTFNTLAGAAKAYGATPKSLSVMLARGGGRCGKPGLTKDGEAGRVACVRVGTNSAVVQGLCQSPENATGRENDTAPSKAIRE